MTITFKGKIELENLIIFAYPNTSLLIEFTSNLIDTNIAEKNNLSINANEFSLKNKYAFQFEIGFRPCEEGELFIHNAL